MAFVRLSHGVRMPLQHVSYSTRDWTEELTALEVREGATSFTADLASPQWLFSYRNTDSEEHFVAITVQCQDLDRHDRARFTYTATLAPTKSERAFEITSRMKSIDWHATMFVRITVDFLSSPTG